MIMSLVEFSRIFFIASLFKRMIQKLIYLKIELK